MNPLVFVWKVTPLRVMVWMLEMGALIMLYIWVTPNVIGGLAAMVVAFGR